jgi:hypothetical protein
MRWSEEPKTLQQAIRRRRWGMALGALGFILWPEIWLGVPILVIYELASTFGWLR